MSNQNLLDLINNHNLSIDARFVPFSQSRYKDEKTPCLNWKVSLFRNGRQFLEFDYMAGMGHAPSYGKKGPANYKYDYSHDASAWECENGVKAKPTWSHTFMPATRVNRETQRTERIRILPKIEDVFYSVCLDSRVLDYANFEEWALEYGYDQDSRKAFDIYALCLKHALSMRAALGQELLTALQNAADEC